MQRARRSRGGRVRADRCLGLLARFAPLMFLIVLMVAFAIIEPRFLTPDQSVQRDAAGLDHRPAGGRHDLRHPDRGHRSFGWLAARFRRPRRRRCRQGRLVESLHRRSGPGALGYGWSLAALAAIAVGLAGGWLQGLAITRLKVPPFVVTLGGMSAFRGAALLFAAGGPISGFEPNVRLVGPGQDRTGSGAGHHLLLVVRDLGPYRASLHALRPAGLCGRRQSGGGAAVGAQRLAGDQQRLRDHGLFRGPWRASCFPRASIRRKPSPAPATS